MALIIPLGPQVKIGVRIGYAKAPTAKLVVMSLTGGAITVICNGVTQAGIAMTATDGAGTPAGYTAEVTISGLSQLTKYSYTVTQTGNAGSVSGSFYTLPGPQDDFCFYAITCDTVAHASISPGLGNGEGFYKNIYDEVNATLADADGLPCVGILHIDDHGYTSARRFTDSAATGLDVDTPATLNTAYAFCAAWLNFYGLHSNGSTEMGTAVNGFGENTAYTTTANIDFGRVPKRVWCMQNLPVWPQWGDWEFKNDIGFDFPTSDPAGLAGNPYHKTYVGTVGQKDGGGYLAWQKFMAPLQPPLLNASNGNAWAFDLGCIKVISADTITNSNGAVTDYTSTQIGSIANDDYLPQDVANIFGSGQITDILAAAGSYSQFTFLGLANSIRYMDNWLSEFQSGAQHPIKNHCKLEWERLFTDTGSLSDKPATNNKQGCLFTLHGDYHNGHIYHHEITDGVVPTNFYEVGLGTATTSFNFNGSLTTGIGQAYKGSTIEYIDVTVSDEVIPERHTYWGCKIRVYGSKAFKEIIIELLGESGVVWSGKFIGQIGNAKFATDFSVPKLQAP